MSSDMGVDVDGLRAQVEAQRESRYDNAALALRLIGLLDAKEREVVERQEEITFLDRMCSDYRERLVATADSWQQLQAKVDELEQALADAYTMSPGESAQYLRGHPHFAEKVATTAAHLREMAQLQARIVELEQSLESSANPTSTTIQATLRAKIDVVRSIHKRDQSVQIHAWTQWYCAADGDPWPCKTIRALDGE